MRSRIQPIRLGRVTRWLFLALLLPILIIPEAFAATPGQLLWKRRYNGPGDGWDQATAVAVDTKGNVYVTGYSTGSGTSSDYTTIKYGTGGKKKWIKRYNGPANGSDEARAIAVDSGGNVYVTGYSTGSGTSFDYLTIKYDSSGRKKWVRRYNGPGNGSDVARAIAVDSSGNVYVTGCGVGSGTLADYTTIKYGPTGKKKWVRRYNGPGNEEDVAQAIAVDSGGNVYVTGYSIGSGTAPDYATIKYGPGGKKKWLKRHNGPAKGSDEARAIAVDSGGNVYVTGYSTGSGTSFDYLTIKYDSSGRKKWVRRYNGPGNRWDEAWAIAVDSSGRVYVTGASERSAWNYDYATIGYRPSGKRRWVKRYNGPGNDEDAANAIALDASGNLYVTGYSRGSGTGHDYTTIKYGPGGKKKWIKRYNGPPGNATDEAHAIAVYANGVYVTGRSYGSGSDYDYATIKYAP